jgi:hypothetical protein
MKAVTRLVTLGLIASGAYAARRAQQNAAAKRQRELQELDELDFADVDESGDVNEHGVIISDAELVPPEDYHPSQERRETAWEMPGRGAGPR